jgi:hypothetical protein
MRLSEAILLGTTICPQNFSAGVGKDGGRCAILSAGLAVGVNSDLTQPNADHWPWLEKLEVDVPEACTLCPSPQPAIWAVVCLNDHAEWTRERIAAWVRTIEPAEISQTETSETAETVLAHG